MGHVNNAAYLDYLEEALAAAGDAARPAITGDAPPDPPGVPGPGGAGCRARRRDLARDASTAQRPGRGAWPTTTGASWPGHGCSSRRPDGGSPARGADPAWYLRAMTAGPPCGARGNRPHRDCRRPGPSPHGSRRPRPLVLWPRVRPSGDRTAAHWTTDPLETVTAALVLGALVALIGALAGTAGFAAVVVRRQNRRLAALIEHLTQAQDEGALIAVDARPHPGSAPARGLRSARGPRRRHLAAGDGRSPDRHRQPAGHPGPRRRGARPRGPLPAPAVGDHGRPRPLQAPQRLPWPRGGRPGPAPCRHAAGGQRPRPSTRRAGTAARSS